MTKPFPAATEPTAKPKLFQASNTSKNIPGPARVERYGWHRSFMGWYFLSVPDANILHEANQTLTAL
jgi:hypothetical protein